MRVSFNLKTWSVQVAYYVTVLDRLFALAQVPDHLDDVIAVSIDALHHHVAQTQHVHAHGPHLRFAADDADISEAQRIRAAVFGHVKPKLPAMSQAAVVDE